MMTRSDPVSMELKPVYYGIRHSGASHKASRLGQRKDAEHGAKGFEAQATSVKPTDQTVCEKRKHHVLRKN